MGAWDNLRRVFRGVFRGLQEGLPGGGGGGGGGVAEVYGKSESDCEEYEEGADECW